LKQFAVIGLGRFGASLAVTLARMGYEVLAVDRDEDRVKAVVDEVTHAVQADALDAEALKALGLKNFDVVVVAIGTDIEASILTTVMLKEMRVRRIMAKANTELHGKVLARVGADKVIFPERDMGVRVAHAMVSGNIIDHIELSSDYSVVELVAPKGLVGKTLGEAEIRGRHGISLIAIRRGADVIVAPGADQVIEEGDILVAIGKTKRFDKWGR